MCWRKEDEVCLDDSDPVLTVEEWVPVVDEMMSDEVIGYSHTNTIKLVKHWIKWHKISILLIISILRWEWCLLHLSYPGLVTFYDTRPGNKVGLFYNTPEPTQDSSLQDQTLLVASCMWTTRDLSGWTINGGWSVAVVSLDWELKGSSWKRLWDVDRGRTLCTSCCVDEDDDVVEVYTAVGLPDDDSTPYRTYRHQHITFLGHQPAPDHSNIHSNRQNIYQHITLLGHQSAPAGTKHTQQQTEHIPTHHTPGSSVGTNQHQTYTATDRTYTNTSHSWVISRHQITQTYTATVRTYTNIKGATVCPGWCIWNPHFDGTGGRRGPATVPFERATVISHKLSIVTIALSLTIQPQFAIKCLRRLNQQVGHFEAQSVEESVDRCKPNLNVIW